MYDKFGLILRIETVNDVSFFKHYRLAEHRDGAESRKLAQMKKGIDSLPALHRILIVSNRRCLELISAIDDPGCGAGKLDKISRAVVENDRPYKGFNIFSQEEQKLFESLSSGALTIKRFSKQAPQG